MLDENTTHVPGWIVTGVGAVIASLASAVVFMFKFATAAAAQKFEEEQKSNTREIGELKKDRDFLRKESEECRKDREELRIKLASLETRIEMQECKQRQTVDFESLMNHQQQPTSEENDAHP